MGMTINNGIIRKGPWKEEEDQVLVNHVKIYGPRDWSSIRSKGLLQRTGKSCRLRWVNKLRPNLKNGCKFTGEEERVVIEMQGQIGNKWATIASYLPGRTDNDVKNFWSSRQKRLARILRSQSPSLPKTINKSSRSSSSTRCIIPVPAARSISAIAPEPPSNKQLTSSTPSPSYTTTTTNSLMESKPSMTTATNHNPSNSESANYPNISNNFPSTLTGVQQNLPLFPLETQELIDRLDFSFFDPFVCMETPPLFDDGTPFIPCSFNNTPPVSAPDIFFDEFPADMFDDIEPLP